MIKQIGESRLKAHANPLGNPKPLGQPCSHCSGTRTFQNTYAAISNRAGRNGIENTIGRVSSQTLTSEPPSAPARDARTRSKAYSRAAASSLKSAALSCASSLSARTVKKYCGIWTPHKCRPDNGLVASAYQQSQRKLEASTFQPVGFERRCQEIV